MPPSAQVLKTELNRPFSATLMTRNDRYLYQNADYYVCIQKGLHSPPTACYENTIYLTDKYLTVKNTENIYSFNLIRHKDKKVFAHLYLSPEPSNIWSSLPSTPFAGIQFYETCFTKEVEFLLKCVENFVKIQQGKEIIIKTAPSNYSIFGGGKLNSIYRQLGFNVEQLMKSHYIPVTKISYESLLSKPERRRLRRCHQAAFKTAMPDADRTSIICTFITDSRSRMGYRLSLSANELENQIRALPQDMVMFAVYDGNTLIAATVTIRVTRNVLYNFLPADLAEYRTFSPTVLLTASVYAYCQAQGICQLDLGTSIDHEGLEKPSLIRFKENIGGQLAQKIIWTKRLNSQTVPVTVENG
jgi:hypothetical protein